jgi:hypothetical protein
LAAGVAVKGAPLILAPIGLVWFLTRRDIRGLMRSLAGAAALLAPALLAYALVAGPSFFDILRYHGDRPLQVESLYSAALMVARLFDPDIASPVTSFGSENIASAWEPALRRVAAFAPALALVGVYGWSWRELRGAAGDPARARILFAAVSAALVAFITLGKVSSPQYFVWLMPAGVLASAFGSRLGRILLIACCLLTQIEYPFAYSLMSDGLDPALGQLILLRDALALAWAGRLLAEASFAGVGPQIMRPRR